MFLMPHSRGGGQPTSVSACATFTTCTGPWWLPRRDHNRILELTSVALNFISTLVLEGWFSIMETEVLGWSVFPLSLYSIVLKRKDAPHDTKHTRE